MSHQTLISPSDGSWANEKCWNPEDGQDYTESLAYRYNISQNNTETPVEQFWK